MSLAIISGKVSKTINGSNLTNALSKSVIGNSHFLRNEERTHDKIVSDIGTIQNTLTDLSNAMGLKNNMYVIGRADQTEKNSWLSRQNWMPGAVSRYTSRAISYWFGDENTQNGIIIDGFDNFRGEISVALPDMPVMYDTSVVNQVVRNANRLTMRVYVDLVHTDDIVQNILQTFANSLAGLTGTIMNAITGDQMNRAQKALSGLQWIQENGTPFKVYTPHKVYDNMMIEKIAPLNDQKMNEILAADITFKEIIPTKSLGATTKSTARLAPQNSLSAKAKILGWLS